MRKSERCHSFCLYCRKTIFCFVTFHGFQVHCALAPYFYFLFPAPFVPFYNKKAAPIRSKRSNGCCSACKFRSSLASLSPICGAPPGSLPLGANLFGAQHGVQPRPPVLQGQGSGRTGLLTAVPHSDCKTGHSPRPPRRTGGTHGQPGLPRCQALPLPLPPQRSGALPPLRGRSHRQPSAR